MPVPQSKRVSYGNRERSANWLRGNGVVGLCDCSRLFRHPFLIVQAIAVGMMEARAWLPLIWELHGKKRFWRVDAVSRMKGTNMDKDRVKGSARQVKGAVKSAAGKIAGDSKLEAEGKGEKAAGKVQNAIGGLKDSIRGK